MIEDRHSCQGGIIDDEQWTCGKGLAANAALPAKFGHLTAAMADLLDVHTRALTGDDASSRAERDAYLSLVKGQRAIALALDAAASEMTGYRDLPMPHHDMHVMTDGRQLEAFERFVSSKRKLLEVLQETLEQDAQMLAAMRSPETCG